MPTEVTTPAQEAPMPCKACQARGKTWNGADPKCAFLSGPFDGGYGWNCATANDVRELCEREGDFRIHHCREENQQYATVSILDFNILPKNDKGYMQSQPVCLWVGWYKQRGRTEAMWLMFENYPPRKPTEAEVLAILQFYAPKETS